VLCAGALRQCHFKEARSMAMGIDCLKGWANTEWQGGIVVRSLVAQSNPRIGLASSGTSWSTVALVLGAHAGCSTVLD
jgi:hypothetical protein